MICTLSKQSVQGSNVVYLADFTNGKWVNRISIYVAKMILHRTNLIFATLALGNVIAQNLKCKIFCALHIDQLVNILMEVLSNEKSR